MEKKSAEICRTFEYSNGREEPRPHELSTTRCNNGNGWYQSCIWCGQEFPNGDTTK